ncbi:sigma-54 interaction domain-containing protein [Shewanella pealeana]|uniref:Sigma54 specific transcriptional regulator, Fis family n=1 Tax=Shewanella pealeana (strain ATCC 700345 / ANG-SQ1) TaxID=398579 RepID=A8H3G2_SHEPA|nr:sigma-54 dependent transcriptional regulator [Shewanella pealeana]ABV87099.1 sigma54 specific transcriptional regulator, Fis family [Shewanella pealeana ATCC 700345]
MNKFKNKRPIACRELLVLDLAGEFFGYDKELKPFRWHCIVADTLSCAKKAAQAYNFQVAVAVISKGIQHQVLSCINELNQRQQNIIWVAVLIDIDAVDVKFTSRLPYYFTDYHHLPVDWNHLNQTLGHAYGMALLKQKEQKGCTEFGQKTPLLGDSRSINNLRSNITKVATSDEAVLISGETGTGKGLCAHLIHNQSRRKIGPFITINCGALPQSLIHSELFGHEKGAFTGADKQYIGHIERANKGTLFLDEIGDLTLESQVNLLQFLEEHIIERLGGSRNIAIDCRIIFASHVNLETAVEEGRFREDLYYRINILHLHAPSLRQHKEDIPLLANEYLNLFSPEHHKYTLTPKALDTMLDYEWPGNVRELKNRIHRAIIMASSDQLTAADLGIKITNINPDEHDVVDLAQHRVVIDTELLLDAIKRNNHNISAAARELKISRTTFYRLIKKCKIKL